MRASLKFSNAAHPGTNSVEEVQEEIGAVDIDEVLVEVVRGYPLL